ncbi:hypothetical protein A4U53_038815 (plasmid) [Rhizobium ruizarguesonis]|uniref:Cupin n=2 Tax=Rhizobium TaxID=379 RepID=A0A179BD42_RHILE|nr:hypothetical protein [Rhizobium leguminosarum]OAP89061.1 hypothetical protein A4U53_33435 [Rhizobium leguminosarum]
MSLLTHGDQKYQSNTLVGDVAEWNALRVEQRHNIGPGRQNCVGRNCTELVYILLGHARVRPTGDGHAQEGMARAGTSWLVPVSHETLLELDGSVDCLLIFLPAKLLEDSAVADGIDPAATQLAYAGGFNDPALVRIGTACMV